MLVEFKKQTGIDLSTDKTAMQRLKEAAEKWGVTPRWINYYCTAGRIPGAMKVATIWLIPNDTEKPADGRRKENKSR